MLKEIIDKNDKNSVISELSRVGSDERQLIRDLLPDIVNNPRLFVSMREQLENLSLQELYKGGLINLDQTPLEIIQSIYQNRGECSLTTEEAVQALLRIYINNENLSHNIDNINVSGNSSSSLLTSVYESITWIIFEGWDIINRII